MKTRKLRNIEVSAIGMGCMGFTHAYGKAPEEKEAIRLVHRAFELGCTFFDTAEMYSYFKNEEFVGKALKELPRNKVIISDKFWPQPLLGQIMPEGKLSEAGIRKSIESSLQRLQTDYIDLYTEHQMEDGSEEQVAYVMGLLIKEGKIRGWGQSSPSAAQIRKANTVTPITAIQERILHDGAQMGKGRATALPGTRHRLRGVLADGQRLPERQVHPVGQVPRG